MGSCTFLEFQEKETTLEEAMTRIAFLEGALQKKRTDLEKEEENLSRTLALVQQLAEENVKMEDSFLEEKAFLANKVESFEKQVSEIIWR